MQTVAGAVVWVMQTTHSYVEIAASYTLWMEYADPSGIDSESEFNAKSISEKVEFLKSCFGEELNN